MAGQRKVSDTELNRSLILLFITYLLLIFMDVQAKKQANSHILNKANIQELNGADALQPLSPILDPEKEIGLSRKIKITGQQLGDKIQTISRDQIQNTGNSPTLPVVSKYPTISWEAILDSLQSVRPARVIQNLTVTNKEKPESKEKLLQAETTVANPNGVYELYFIQYANKKNVLVATKRWTKKSPLHIKDILTQLKQGATKKERSLLNNFTPDISVLQAKREGTVAVLNLGDGMSRYGSHVIQDRLDQLVYTLTQFPEIKSVRILINGKREFFLGDIPIDSHLIRRGREVYRYNGPS